MAIEYSDHLGINHFLAVMIELNIKMTLASMPDGPFRDELITLSMGLDNRPTIRQAHSIMSEMIKCAERVNAFRYTSKLNISFVKKPSGEEK